MDIKNLNAMTAYRNAANIAGAAAPVATMPGEKSQVIAPDFMEMVAQSLGDVADSSRASEAQSIKSLSGKVSLDDLATSITNAELSLRTVIAVRDKVIEAYKTITQMPI